MPKGMSSQPCVSNHQAEGKDGQLLGDGAHHHAASMPGLQVVYTAKNDRMIKAAKLGSLSNLTPKKGVLIPIALCSAAPVRVYG